jgi:hypothetical protein
VSVNPPSAVVAVMTAEPSACAGNYTEQQLTEAMEGYSKQGNIPYLRVAW